MHIFRQFAATLAVSAGLGVGGCATDGNSDVGRIMTDVFGATQGSGISALSEQEIAAGLREALTVGSQTVVTQLASTDGFFGDDQIRIPLPSDLANAQSKLSKLGLSGPLDDLELKLNRAAEEAAPTAKKLVVDAVSSMTIDDALGILNGGNTAATDFLKAKTSTSLSNAFLPFMDDALNQSGAVTALESTASKYLPESMVQNARADMTQHAVDGALDGLFFYLAKEEQAIRQDPVKRTTELLKRVFGA